MAYAYVYIMASQKKGTIYIGVTRDLGARVLQHKTNFYPKSFTSKYSVHRLVHVEEFDLIAEAIAYEKRLKGWNRPWKIELIEKTNPDWRDIDSGSYEFL